MILIFLRFRNDNGSKTHIQGIFFVGATFIPSKLGSFLDIFVPCVRIGVLAVEKGD